MRGALLNLSNGCTYQAEVRYLVAVMILLSLMTLKYKYWIKVNPI